MSATIPETMLLSDLLKPTGYDCPEAAVGKTVTEIMAGEGAVTLSAWKADTAIVYTKTTEPTTSDKVLVPASTGITEGVIASVAEEFASITIGETTYTRYSDGDLTL